MIKTKVLLSKLSKKFPKKLALRHHDFVGLMHGKLPETISKIMVCLDFDMEIFEIAEKERPDLIITHHPFIFGKKKNVLKFDELKNNLCQKLDELNIPVYSYHTNFDEGKGGMNDALSEKLGLINVIAPIEEGMMRIGELENEMPVEQFAKFAKEAFRVDYSLLINKGTKNIKKVAIIGGGGSYYWKLAKKLGADIYISGDAPHHVRRDIVNYQYNYLDMPHEIEKIFMSTMKKHLMEIDANLEIVEVDHEKLPIVI